MKKLKFLTLAAIAAATAMVSSCSDNDVLEGAKSKGVPLTVNATTTSNGSRSTDILSKDLTTFQLWGFGIDENRFDGDNFTKNGSVFKSATDHIYPGSDNYLFYGISNNTSTMAYGVPTGSPGINTSKADIVDDGGKFVYTIPTNVADQEDLLVAAAKGNATQGVTMHFDHALTAAKLNLKMTPELSENYYKPTGTHYMFVMKIQKIIIHNIKISGTYTFGAGTSVGASSWTAAENGSWDTDDGTVGDYVLDFTANPLFYQVKYNETLNVPINIDGNNSNIYFIPQTIDSWNIAANMTGADANNYQSPSDTKSYVEILAYAAGYEYENISTYLDEVINSLDTFKELYGEDFVVVKDDDGNYYDDNAKTHMVVNKDGLIVDFNTYAIADFASTETPNGYQLNTIADEDNYGVLYKTFKATLGINGNRNLTIELVNACRAEDGSGAFGSAVEAHT